MHIFAKTCMAHIVYFAAYNGINFQNHICGNHATHGKICYISRLCNNTTQLQMWRFWMTIFRDEGDFKKIF